MSLVLGPSVLKPDLDLPLRKSQGPGQFSLLSDCNVGTEEKLLLQLEPLLLRVNHPVLVTCPGATCDVIISCVTSYKTCTCHVF